MIGIIDYGMGNLRSVEKAFQSIDGNCTVLSKPGARDGLSGLVLPGVGAFGQAMDNLRRDGWDEWIRGKVADGMPLLGICLGLQLLFSRSEEEAGTEGLGLLEGRVVRFEAGDLPVPHMGWNRLDIRSGSPIFSGIENGSYVYFVHSYYPVPLESGLVSATTDYGIEFASAVSSGNIHGLQFHPEKSQAVGLRIIRNFVGITEPVSGN